jgi:hypothetical protein
MPVIMRERPVPEPVEVLVESAILRNPPYKGEATSVALELNQYLLNRFHAHLDRTLDGCTLFVC